MSIGMRILIGLAATLAIAGLAQAQNDPCPECDPDGPPGDGGSHHSFDGGVTDPGAEALADTDVSLGESDDEDGFWTWLSLCLSLFVAHLETLLGVDLDADANAEAYASDDGVDLDATVQIDRRVCDALDGNVTAPVGDDGGCTFAFDRSELGDADGATWETLAHVRHATGAGDVNLPVGGEHVEEHDMDHCVPTDPPGAPC